jgi:hypothetical protein
MQNHFLICFTICSISRRYQRRNRFDLSSTLFCLAKTTEIIITIEKKVFR